MSPCVYHESLPITKGNVYTISPEIEITDMQKRKFLEKYNLQKCRNTNYRNTEIKITERQKYKLQNYRNINYRNKNYRNKNYWGEEIQITGLQKYP